MSREALIIVDMQPGFTPERADIPGSGELPVPGAHAIVDPINSLVTAFGELGDEADTIFTKDQHPKPKVDADGNIVEMTRHFSETPDYEKSWPIHCVAGSPGGEIHPLVPVPDDAVIVHKGTEVLHENEFDTSYSGFSGHVVDTGERMPDMVRRRDVTSVIIGGIAGEYCVKQTAMSAVEAGLEVTVVEDATAWMSAQGKIQTLAELADLGVRIARTKQVVGELALR